MKRLFITSISMMSFAALAAITFMSPAAASTDINFSDQNTQSISQNFYGPVTAMEDVEFSFKSDAETAPLNFAQRTSETPSLMKTKALRSVSHQIIANAHRSFQITADQILIPLRI